MSLSLDLSPSLKNAEAESMKLQLACSEIGLESSYVVAKINSLFGVITAIVYVKCIVL